MKNKQPFSMQGPRLRQVAVDAATPLLLLAGLLVAASGCTLFLDTSLAPPILEDADIEGDATFDASADVRGDLDLVGADVAADAVETGDTAFDAVADAADDLDLGVADVGPDDPDLGSADSGADGSADSGEDADLSQTQDAVDCDGAPVNACGGCETLDGEPGEPCGTSGLWVCVGPDRLACREG